MTSLNSSLRRCLRSRSCLVGIGNVDLGDDGAGVHLAQTVARALATPSAQPSPCAILIAGTTPEDHLTYLTDALFDHVIFLDAVDCGTAPGSVVWLDAPAMAARCPQVSTHKISLGLLAKWIESNGRTRVWLLGVQPQRLNAGPTCSAPVSATLDLLATLLIDSVRPARSTAAHRSRAPVAPPSCQTAC